MRKIYFLLLTVLFVANASFAQTYLWQGDPSGDYNVATNWTPTRTTPLGTDILQFNNAAPILLTNVPNQTIGAIQVTGTSTVSFAANAGNTLILSSATTPLIYSAAGSILAADFLTITISYNVTISSGTFGIAPGTGGKVIINGALTLSGGKLDFDVAGTGGATINGSITYNTGIFTSANASSITWAATSTYNHNADGSFANSIPVSVWATGSKCVIGGLNAGTQVPTGFDNIFFSNITWNCLSQFGDVSWLPVGATLFVSGNLTITSTGSSALNISSVGKAFVNAGNYTQNGGIVTLQAAATLDTTIFSVSGSFNQNAGTINGVGGASPGVGILDLKGSVTTAANPTTWQSPSTSNLSQFIVQFSGTSPQTVSLSANWNGPAQGRCNILVSNVTGVNLTGYLRVTNQASASAATFTMNGKLSGSGSVTYFGSGAGGKTLIYSGAFPQTASVIEFPASNGPLNLTINNPLGVVFPSNFTREIKGQLRMVSGNLAIDNFATGNKLELTSTSLSSQLSYLAGYITTGKLGRRFPATGLPTTANVVPLFPFGTGANNRGLDVFFSSGSGGTEGMIYVEHTPSTNVTNFLPSTIADNGVNLDKRTDTKWTISTGPTTSVPSLFTPGAATVSITAVGGNIGAVDNIVPLRLTDGATPNFGSLIATTGSTSVPVVGKSLLPSSVLNSILYIGSDGTNVYNPLVIIIFTWTGLGGNTDWTNSGNWTAPTTTGYPSASTEIALITSTSGTQPTVNTGNAINLYQLTLGGSMTLTMAPTSSLYVYDNMSITGATGFDVASTFGYARPSTPQTVLGLDYGNLALIGAGDKTFGNNTIKVRNAYTNTTGGVPTPGNSTFIYAGAGSQRITEGNYFNLSIINPRSSGVISIGNTSSGNIIDVNGTFSVGATGYSVIADFNTFNFSSPSLITPQVIPGFTYGLITDVSTVPTGALRKLDPLGTSSIDHVINCRSLTRGSQTYDVVNSKVNYILKGDKDRFFTGDTYHDLTFSGDNKNKIIDFNPGATVNIRGKFSFETINFKQGTNKYTFVFDGAADQTIPSFKTISATTPLYKYSNVDVKGGSRNVTLAGTDTIAIRETLTNSTSFSGGGFLVAGSTVSFSVGSSSVPALKPASGTNNYYNLDISGGTHVMADDMTIGKNLSISGTDASPGILNIGNGSNSTTRVENVLGDIIIAGTGGGTKVTGQLDMNTGTTGTLGSAKINLAGNLNISGYGQVMGTTSDNSRNGQIVFNGTLNQTYSNTAVTFKNGLVNFIVGDGVNPSKLTLVSSMNLLTNTPPTLLNRDTLMVSKFSSIDFGTYNLTGNGSGTANFQLRDSATLITSNTGGVEGAATASNNGSVTNNGTLVRFYSDSASYTFNGITSTPFSSTSTITKMANLTLAANVSLDKDIKISNTLNQGAVNFSLNAYDVTLTSTAGSTARVAPIPGGATISYGGNGRFNVERYYPARRSWRYVTTPLTQTNSIFDMWQLGGADYTTQPNLGTWITGPVAANGIDNSIQKNVSLKMGSALTNVSNTTGTYLSNNVASNADNLSFFLFVRGDRRPANFNTANTNTTTLRGRGVLQTGTQTFLGASTAGAFTLIGNPYASPVNFAPGGITKNNLTNRIYVWDPYLQISLGAYVLVDIDVNGIVTNTTPSSIGNLAVIGQPLTIQSGQAFWIETATNAFSSIVFNEAAKSATYNKTAFRPMGEIKKSFRTNLYLVEPSDTIILADGNYAQFDNSFSKDVDRMEDATKANNIAETFGFERNKTSLAVEKRPEITENDTLFFKLIRTKQRNYRFEFVPENLNAGLSAFLEDSYTKVSTPVSVTATSVFDFTINADTASAAANRFRIVFKTAGNGPLPVTYKSIKAYQQATNIAVEWTVENEINISKYEVEKSTDGIHFDKVNTTGAKGGNSNTYTFIDKNAVQGNNFYRILSYSQDGAAEYSRIVLVKIGETAKGISIYPNPVTGNSIGVAINNQVAGKYNVRLVNTLGQTVLTRQLIHSAGNSIETLTPNSKLSAGIYQLQVTTPDNGVTAIKVVVQ